MNRTSWIDFEEWARIGQPIKSTSSVEAVRMYDAAVCQYSSWFDNDSLGGLEGTIAKMRQADPDFLLGEAFELACTLMGYTETAFNNQRIAKQAQKLAENAEKRRNEITVREYNHVQAVVRFANMDWTGASSYWEKVLHESPTDIFALKSELFSNFFTGNKINNFNMVDRVYPAFEKAPNYHNQTIHGYYAFVLEEVGKYQLAEPYAKKGLELCPSDGWTTHSLAHIIEMKGFPTEGKRMMSTTTQQWNRASHIGCHNWWHLALFNVSLGDYDTAIDILDNEIVPRTKATQGTGPICDLNALLFRLLYVNEHNGLSEEFFQSHFDDAYSISKQYHKDKIVNPFTTLHYMMACLGSKNRSDAEELLEDFRRSKHAEIHPEVNAIGCKLLEAFMLYDEGKYGQAAEILLPIRHEFVKLGGSDAQRDVFHQLVMCCTLKSTLPQHKDAFEILVKERENTKFDDMFVTKITI